MQLIRKGVLYTLLIFLGVIGNQSVVLAQQPDVRLYKQLSNYPFVFVSDSVVTTPPVISDSLVDGHVAVMVPQTIQRKYTGAMLLRHIPLQVTVCRVAVTIGKQ